MPGNMNVDHNNVPCHWCATNKNLIQQLGLPPCNKQQVKPADCSTCTWEKSRTGRNFQCHENPGSAFPGNPFRSKGTAASAGIQSAGLAGNQSGLAYNQPSLISASTNAATTSPGASNLYILDVQPQAAQFLCQAPVPHPTPDHHIAALEARQQQLQQQIDALRRQQLRRDEQEDELERRRHRRERERSLSPDFHRRGPSRYDSGSQYGRFPDPRRRPRELMPYRRHSPPPDRRIMSHEPSFEQHRRRSPEQYRRFRSPMYSPSRRPPDGRPASSRNTASQHRELPEDASIGSMPHEFPPGLAQREGPAANREFGRRSSMAPGLHHSSRELRRDD